MVHSIIGRFVAFFAALLLFMPLITAFRAWRFGCSPVFDSAVDVVFTILVSSVAMGFLVLAIAG